MVLVRKADSTGHSTLTMTKEEAVAAYPFGEFKVVAVDGVPVKTRDEFGSKLSQIVDEAAAKGKGASATQAEVDVVPQIAGGC